MTLADKKRFYICLVAASEYYGKALSEAVIDLWWQGLQPYEIGSVERALSAHMRNPDNGQFMPKIADFTRLIGGSTTDRALVAWSKVDKAVRQVGPYQSVIFDDPIIHRIIHEMGGWITLGDKSEDDWPFVAREFESRYRGYAIRDETPPYPHVIIGIAGADNSRRGFKAPLPVLIGVPEKCKEVLSNGVQPERMLQITFVTAGDMATSVKSEVRYWPENAKLAG